MKKLLLFFCCIIFLSEPSWAICNYMDYCARQAYDLSNNLSQIISKKTGATFISEKLAETRIKDEFKKVTKQKINVSIKSYSFLDLFRGRFKSITITGKNLDINGVYLTYLELKSLCDFNYVDFNKSPIIFKENMVIKFSTVISAQDLMNTMDSSGYLDRLNCVNVHGCGITFFKLSGAGVNITGNKLHFKIKITSEILLEKPIDIMISTNLSAKNGRLMLTKIDLKNVVKGVDLSKVANQLNTMNPLTFSLNLLENRNSKMCINNVKISGNKIYITGNIFIPKSETQSKINNFHKKLHFKIEKYLLSKYMFVKNHL